MIVIPEYENISIRDAKVVSFDIFDTVITRITADPSGIFLKLQKKLTDLHLELPTQLLQHFAQSRADAERAARRKKTHEEVLFLDIYLELGRRYNLTEEIIRRLMELEIDTELECIKPIPANFRRIHDFRKAGKRIIFISDMYLPLIVIRRILERAGIFSEKDEIYVSSEFGLTKSTGNLYLGVLAQEKCSPRQVVHIGDNHKSDYLMARKVGKISAFYFRDCRFTRFENIMRKSNVRELELSWQLIAGASRIARLESHEQNDPQRRALHEIGANVVGPILWGYVSWVLEQASLRKIRRLYFIARDGHILYEIALRLRSFGNDDIELRYLYGSRQAWHLPAVSVLTDRELHWITVKDPFLSLRLVASRLCLDVNVVLTHMQEAGFPAVTVDHDLSETEIRDLKMLFSTNDSLQSLIFAEAQRKREDVIGYLRQEGLLDDTRCAIVDSGWNGRLQNSLNSILHLAGRKGDIFGYYFGLLSAIDPPGSKEAYFFSPTGPVEYMQFASSVLNLLELMMSADHGITVSYKKTDNGHWEPVLKDITYDLMGDLGLGTLREGVARFIDHLDLASIKLDHDHFRLKIMQLLNQFYLSPSHAAAIALGRLPFSTDQTERNFLPFAPALSLKDALRYALTKSGKERMTFTFWIHGSRVQSSLLTNSLLFIMSLLYRFIHNIKKTLLFRYKQMLGGK